VSSDRVIPRRLLEDLLPEEQRHDQKHQEDVEEDLGDLGRVACNARETQHGSDQRDDQEGDDPA
jgi:hypothetical protein